MGENSRANAGKTQAWGARVLVSGSGRPPCLMSVLRLACSRSMPSPFLIEPIKSLASGILELFDRTFGRVCDSNFPSAMGLGDRHKYECKSVLGFALSADSRLFRHIMGNVSPFFVRSRDALENPLRTLERLLSSASSCP